MSDTLEHPSLPGIARPREPSASWAPVFALALGAFALVASEFMPVSLLTPIATDLHITEGAAGQAISISGAFALITSLSISSLAGRVDRKLLLLSLTLLMVISGIVVATASNYGIFMVGRALIGVAIGGFWSMSAATAMRLVADHQVPKALAIVNGGNALATVIAAPLGSYLGAIIGWRWAFFAVVPVAMVAFVWKLLSLPALQPQGSAGARALWHLMKRPAVSLGMIAVSLFFMGQFSLFTYLRPFLEVAGHANVQTVSGILLVMGVAGFAGTAMIGSILQRRLYGTLVVIPLVMAAIAGALIWIGASLGTSAVLLGVWGLIATAAPVGWWTWLSRTLPRDAEAGGGLMVAIVQLAIMLGATLGGLLYDASGYQATFGLSAALLLIAAGFTVLAARAARN